jgi:hypothetical protein
MTSCVAWAAGLLLATGIHAATNDTATAEVEGQQLVRQLRQLQPSENSSLTGVLKIFHSRSKRIEVPVQMQTLVTATNWQITYTASSANSENRMSVTIIHAEDQPNQYRLAQTGQSGCGADPLNFLTGSQTMIPFAGSDFWLADLGLEFFHWPGQKLLKKELRSGQSCSVLESANPRPVAGGYARIVSWIDIDTGGIVHAEAYDTKGDRLKRFEPKALKKVNGQWQLQEMQIRNLKTGSRTTIEFNLSQE